MLLAHRFSTGIRHLAVTCASELLSLTGHLGRAQRHGNARCPRVRKRWLHSYQIITANSPRGRARVFTKKNFHVYTQQRNPFQIFTTSKGYLCFCFFLFLCKWDRRDTRADAGHSDTAACTSFLLAFQALVKSCGVSFHGKVASTKLLTSRLHSG